MRRPRHKLQISTFPFLAVLLGAMGSLIFLLLVMDRRAKIVARNKVRETQEARMAAANAADQGRRDEWERQRKQLHATLAAQDQALRGQLQVALGALQNTEKQLKTSASVQVQLQTRINAERARLQKERDELRQRQAALLKSDRIADGSKTELAKLTRDLLDLEQTLDGLRRLRNEKQPTYSLVPFHGQRGANRMPIYIECTAAGLVFLPDGMRRAGADLDIPHIRAEVERRHGPLVKAARANPFKPNPADEEPYVLFLVRPDGIGSYYRGQNALRGYQIDFGYELVDAGWTLDVPSPAEWKTFAQMPAPVADHSAVSRSPSNVKGPAFVNGPSGQPNGPGGSGIAGGSVTAANEVGSVRSEPPGTVNGFGNDGPGAARTPSVGGMTDTAPRATIGFAASTSGIPEQKTPGFAKLAVDPTTASNDPKSPAGDASPTFRPAQPKGSPRSPLEGPAPGLRTSGAAAKGDSAASGAASAKPQATSASPANAGEPPPPGTAMNRLAIPSPVSEKQAKASPVSLSRVIGNRDFIVTIACYAEGVVVSPGGASFAWKDKGDAQQIDEALVRTVLQLVERRQATVRAGEPPYRAVLRFEVREQGRRTYHHVFPLLDGLRLPMVREDVEE